MFNDSENAGFLERRKRFCKRGLTVKEDEEGEFHGEQVVFCGRLISDFSTQRNPGVWNSPNLRIVLNTDTEFKKRIKSNLVLQRLVNSFPPVPPGAKINIELARSTNDWCMQSFNSIKYNLVIDAVALLCPMLVANSVAFSHFLASWKSKPIHYFLKKTSLDHRPIAKHTSNYVSDILFAGI